MDHHILIRSAHADDAGAIARVHIESWRSTYRGTLSEAYLNSLSYERREEHWRQVIQEQCPPQLLWVATDPIAGVIGFINGGPERTGSAEITAELYVLYVLVAFQRLGVGRRLFSTASARWVEEGHESLIAWVLESNHDAAAFYEAMGGKPAGVKPIEIDHQLFVQSSYVWSLSSHATEAVVSLTPQEVKGSPS